MNDFSKSTDSNVSVQVQKIRFRSAFTLIELLVVTKIRPKIIVRESSADFSGK